MDAVWQWGIGVVVWLQQFRAPPLDAAFRFFTFLGEEEFYILLLPLFLWSLDFGLGARVGIVFLASAFTNTILKDLIQHPRPFVLNPGVQAAGAEGYGLPSGHAQLSAAVWGTVGAWARRPWVWIAVVPLAGLIGISRVYLGVHFPTDVAAGWLLGAAAVFFYWAYRPRLDGWLARQALAVQLGLALVVPVGLFLLYPVNGTASELGALTGVGVGLALVHRSRGFDAGGPIWQRGLRFLVGVLVLVVLYLGLRAVFPAEGAALYLPLRFLRYALVGVWAAFGAPWLFTRLRLAGRVA